MIEKKSLNHNITMKKKLYVTPQLLNMELSADNQFMTSSPLTNISDEKEADPDKECLAGRRRDSWGDLWGD